MQRRITSLLAVLAAALPFATQADTMDYSYAEAWYVDSSLDVGDTNVDGNGFALRGSIPIMDNWFAFAMYQDVSYDLGVDATTLAVGGGYHWPLRDKLDIIGRAGIVQSNIDAGRFDDHDSGFLLGARLRTELAPKFEVEGGFDYVNLDDQGNDTVGVLEGRYFFMNQLAGGLSLQLGDATTVGINVRLTF